MKPFETTYFFLSLEMKFSSIILLLIGGIFQSTLAAAPDPNSQSNLNSWQGPSGQNDIEAYIQRVQNFWTNERTADASPNPMPSSENKK